jgi:cholesterol oxidase
LPTPSLSKHTYEAIVLGSGFGGAVAACRLAQAGVDVAILERGRRFELGSFRFFFTAQKLN